MIFSTYIISMNLLLNIFVVVLSFLTIGLFHQRGVVCFNRVREQIKKENDFYTELMLGLESVGQNVCSPKLMGRETRIAVWELYNNLRVQPSKENKSIVLQRKMLEKKQELYYNLEEAKINLEVLPFLGIIGTLLGFAAPHIFNLSGSGKVNFDLTGVGFFLAISSTICALLTLIYLKKTYEAHTMADFDYYLQQQKSIEKIMIEYDGFKYLGEWLEIYPDAMEENSMVKTRKIQRALLDRDKIKDFQLDLDDESEEVKESPVKAKKSSSSTKPKAES